MGDKIVVGPVNKGLRTDRLPFVIDNDSFPQLINAYQWRGRVKRKRGTSPLGQLQRWVGTTDGSGAATLTITPAPSNSGTSVFKVGSTTFTDQGGTYPYNLLSTGTATAQWSSAGTLVISGAAISTAVIQIPMLPVMGLEELFLNPNLTPGELGFDTIYSYNISTTSPYTISDVSYYKNPQSGPAGYVAKTNPTPVTWNGQDYQQFWSVNYEGALWATNGVTVPFSTTNVGLPFAPITSISGSGTSVTIATTASNTLVIGDWVYINEVAGTMASTINFQTGYVTNVGAGTITVKLPDANVTGSATGNTGIVIYLTNRSDVTKDCIRWYDGDPTNGVIPPTFNSGKGWVNYCPVLSQGNYTISDLPAAIYYLVGCKMIVNFKDRLLFLGPVVQTSTGSPIYLQDTIVYTQNGTPYYTASFTGSPVSVATTFFPLLVPDNQTATAPALFEDQIGFGGYIYVGTTDTITTLGKNEDALIVGFTRFQTRILASGNDVVPFEFFIVNSELGSASTFSSITMDQGVLTRGNRGFVITNQTSTARFDLEVIDQVFEIAIAGNGNERMTAQRDFENEWIYFTYNYSYSGFRYPNQTLFYNYRDNSFGIFYESVTTYGTFAGTTGKPWSQYTDFPWEDWDAPWNSGTNDNTQSKVILGNQQGFVLFRETNSTNEANSLYIQNISGSTVTCNNHNLNNGDYYTISGAQGTNVNLINGQVFQVINGGTNTFSLPALGGTVTYTGGGFITRMYIPFMQTKQFPLAWDIARKTRIGPQQYLLTTTDVGQITVNMYLSQDNSVVYNSGQIPPQPYPINGSLVYSQLVYTCPESTNLGLTPFNTNLNMLCTPTDGHSTSAQIWHRMNTSLIGDTVQLAFTLSDAQMQDTTLQQQFEEIELHSFILDVSPAGMLA